MKRDDKLTHFMTYGGSYTSVLLKVKQFPLTNWPYSLDNILYLNYTLLLNAILTKSGK